MINFMGFCDSEQGETIMNLVKTIIDLIKIGIPVILVVLGMLDLGKAVVASKEDEIKSAQKLLTKRAIAAVAVFFVITIVQLIFTEIIKDDNGGDWRDCLNQLG